MPVSKPAIVENGTRRAAEAHPAERPWVTFQATSGELGETLSWATIFVWALSLYETLVERLYTVVLTDHHVLFIRTGRVFHRVKRVKHTIPRAQFLSTFSDLRWDGYGDAEFRYQLPGRRRPSKMRVISLWQRELHYFLTSVGQQQPQPPYQQQPWPPSAG
ncbi:hypothetical protein [Streptomyces profundus]|uniref:hypothetical protein n=1 Tax=Streptomyces profundus TaxID=2867410 RepID=UPI001D16E014|nr:hypothetical protein [Streptomyces sp. MA3_2.13]UED84710.1 hypothetical protein K4G22_11235 [Streptomyces sp. MA3_2.13]